MVGTRLISAKIRWILPKNIKDSVDLPDFVKESVPQIQILCTFQARLARNPVRTRTRTSCTRGRHAHPHTRSSPRPAHPRTRTRILRASAGA